MATDWKSIAAARGLDAAPPQVEKYAEILGALETQMAALKQTLPYDAEPATFPQPVLPGGRK